jgi:hypothetical protein
MNKINRNTFIKHSLKVGALVLLNPFSNSLAAYGAPLNIREDFSIDDILKRLVIANDVRVEKLLQSDLENSAFGRKIGYDFAALASAYSSTGSKFYKSASIVSALQKLTTLLLAAQTEDGTVNIGNLESPPDTAFLIELVAAGASLIINDKTDGIASVNKEVKKFMQKAGDALAVGGVHTPNHRWVVSAALARLNALYPNQKYIDRIEDWLGEGIYQDADGHYPERSNIYGNVENTAFITIARLAKKPQLLEHVRKNLTMTYYYMEPNGEVVTNDSRRQDQYEAYAKNILLHYLSYRYMAIKDNNSLFAGITRLIENVQGFDEEIISNGLFHFLEEPLLQKDLPAPASPPVNYEKLFTTSHLLRIRRNDITTTFFGGVDWPLIIASGRCNSPNFYSYRKGNAILKYMRLSTSFFSTGYFYSSGLKKDGNKYVLHKKIEAPYYQPLLKKFRKPDGDYQLSESIDGRFWNKMDFKDRPISNVKTLETTISFSETSGNNELVFDVAGQKGVAVTIELCFKEGGKLSGVSPGERDNSFLEQGFGKYELGGDVIEFGPGAVAHKSITNLEGERYTTHFGSLRTEGMHVYITGVTPFKHKLSFK